MGEAESRHIDRTTGLELTNVLFLPGLLGDEAIFSAQVEGLSSVANAVVAEYRSATRLEEMAGLALDVADGSVSVVGHSMGARVGLEMWRAAPERIDRLALFDFWVGPVAEGEREKRKVMTDLSASQGIEAVAEAWVASMVHPDRTADRTLVEPLHEIVCRFTPEQHAGQIDALLNRVDLMPLLPTITVPTLIGVGRQDPWRSVDQHEQMTAAIDGARLEIVEDCGHMSPVEQPAAVTGLLLRWLEWER